MERLGSLFTVAVTLLLPIALGVWLSLKKKGFMKPVLLGAATFLAFQVFTRVQALNFMSMTAWYSMFSMTQPVLFALFLGVTAALFEEGGRWIVMKLFMKNKHRVSDGIAFGIGHGGIEAVTFVGIGMTVALLTNVPTPPFEAILSGIERLMTMVLHVGWSVMVLRSVTQRKPFWLIVAFVMHTAVDMIAVLLGQIGVAPLWIEAAILPFVFALLVYTILEYKKVKGGEMI